MQTKIGWSAIANDIAKPAIKLVLRDYIIWLLFFIFLKSLNLFKNVSLITNDLTVLIFNIDSFTIVI
jgi:hypothetical protein